MNKDEKEALIKTSWQLHNQIETSYLSHKSAKGDNDWLEKQRLLLADMAIHLLQTALQPEKLELDKLKNNLHAILTISDQFLPHAKLIQATEKIYQSE
ncbi:hypothetical protein ACUR5C_00700 [Aliikangiella sp. IMCC44653]